MPLFSNDAARTGVQLSDALAAGQIQLGQDQRNWFEQAYRDFAPARDAAAARSTAVGDASMALMGDSAAQATDLNAFQRDTYRPLQRQIVSEAQGYNTPERQRAAAEAAGADVGIALGNQQGALSRSLARTGVQPGSGASMAAMGDMALAGTKLQAGARTQAARNVESEGFGRMLQANQTGAYLPGAAAQATNTAVNAGQAAGAANTEALRARTSGVPLMEQAFAGQLSANQSAGNLYNASQSLRGQTGGANFGQVMQGVGGIAQGLGSMTPQQWTNLGNAASGLYNWGSNAVSGAADTVGDWGTAAMNWLSTKSAKEKTSDVKGDEALAQVNKLDVDQWRYLPGMSDGGAHVGPYAEDVQATMGDKVAPGGKMVNLHAMAGKNAAAIKKLTQMLASVEGEIEQLQAA